MTDAARKARQRDPNRAEAVATGRPELSVADQDRDLLEDLVAAMLAADLERDTEGAAA